MAEKQLLGVTGFARAGKSRLLTHLESAYGFTVVSPSKVIQERLQAQTGRTQFDREELREAGLRIRQTEGPDFIVKALDSLSAERVVVDGIRNLSAARSFRRTGGIMLGLVARADVRFQRATFADDDKHPPSDIETMLRDESAELRSLDKNGLHILPILWEIEPDHIIDTSDMSVMEMQQSADSIMQSLGIEPRS